MKHTLRVTLILVALFLIAQLVGLTTVNRQIMVFKNTDTGTITIEHPDTVLGPPPVVQNKSTSFILLGILVLIGTALLLLLIRFKAYRFWKLWFFVAVWATMSVSFGVYLEWLVAVIIAFGLTLWKIYKPNVYIYNFTEIFIYTGITLLLLNILDIYSAFGMLILISLYDMYAVWKSKHMIKMANFQAKSNVFAGLLIPYKRHTGGAVKAGRKGAKKETKSAILGGGDIAFPMLFSAAIMEHLIIFRGVAKDTALAAGGIISVFAAIALLILLVKAEDGKFYPAMPFLSAGCFVGYIIVYLLF